jgi:apolipoprotein N-acyltransferase
VPTMDVVDWGKHEHQLHALVAPMKAAEYGIPIFRVASSGVSQLVARDGSVLCSLPFPAQGQIIAGEIRLALLGRVPLDRYLAPFASGLTALLVCWFVGSSVWRKRAASSEESNSVDPCSTVIDD